MSNIGDMAKLNPITYLGVGSPKLGDTARACDIGYIGRGIRVWVACPQCGRERWQGRRFMMNLCPRCGIPKGGQLRRGCNNTKWAGGKRHAEGYIFITVDETHPFFVMATKSAHAKHYQIAEHRLVVAQNIGRALTDGEIVHHVNGIRSDNRIENLQLLQQSQHHARLVLNDLQARYRNLETRVTLLEAENTLLQFQLESKLIPNQAEEKCMNSSLGVCRDLTGDTPRG